MRPPSFRRHVVGVGRRASRLSCTCRPRRRQRLRATLLPSTRPPPRRHSKKGAIPAFFVQCLDIRACFAYPCRAPCAVSRFVFEFHPAGGDRLITIRMTPDAFSVEAGPRTARWQIGRVWMPAHRAGRPRDVGSSRVRSRMPGLHARRQARACARRDRGRAGTFAANFLAKSRWLYHPGDRPATARRALFRRTCACSTTGGPRRRPAPTRSCRP